MTHSNPVQAKTLTRNIGLSVLRRRRLLGLAAAAFALTPGLQAHAQDRAGNQPSTGALAPGVSNTAPEAAASWNEIGRALAGQSPTRSFQDEATRQSWSSYAEAVTANWQQYRERMAEPMRQWSSTEVPAAQATVFYPFSGPDFATLDNVYPAAKRYVMIAMQRAERPVDLLRLKPQSAVQTLEVLTDAWRHYGRDGFFVTEYLDRYLTQNQVRIGASTFLLTFLQLKGYQVNDISPIRVDERGNIEVLPRETREWLSVRFSLVRDGTPVELDYLRIDLSDKGLSQNPGHHAFVRQMAQHPSLLKAASHLPQNKTFSMVAQAMLDQGRFILQDETGLKYTRLQEQFDTVLYGRFEKAHGAFPSYHRDLAKAFTERKDTRPLNFRVGYYKDGNYVLIAARRRTANR
jgi:hypothetical protein